MAPFILRATLDTAKDKVYKTDGTEQQVVWAIGPLNTNKETAKHYAPPQGRINGGCLSLTTDSFCFTLVL